MIDLEKNKINIGIIIFRVISIIIILICVLILLLWQKDNSSNSNIQNDLSSLISIKETEITLEDQDETNNSSSSNNDDIVEENLDSESDENTDSSTLENLTSFSVDFEALKSKNTDSVAWIKINNTNINYPIVKASNNSYYLKRNFNKEKNSAGWIFADYRNNFETLDTNTIVYGHNRRNGTMFSNLNYYLNTEWCSNEENKYFNFITGNQNYIAEIFSVYKVRSSNVSLTNNFTSVEEFQENIDAWKNASIYDFKTDVTTDDKILTLCTCDNNNSYRILIISKLMPID